MLTLVMSVGQVGQQLVWDRQNCLLGFSHYGQTILEGWACLSGIWGTKSPIRVYKFICLKPNCLRSSMLGYSFQSGQVGSISLCGGEDRRGKRKVYFPLERSNRHLVWVPGSGRSNKALPKANFHNKRLVIWFNKKIFHLSSRTRIFLYSYWFI